MNRAHLTRRMSVLGKNRDEVIANLKKYEKIEKIVLSVRPKASVIIRELTTHPEQHYEEIDFLVDNQLSFAEMLDLIDRSKLEDWHIELSQLNDKEFFQVYPYYNRR